MKFDGLDNTEQDYVNNVYWVFFNTHQIFHQLCRRLCLDEGEHSEQDSSNAQKF